MSSKKDHSFTKQHIVPRAYLNHFAIPGRGKNKYMIGVRQKDRKHYIASTEDVGFIKNYYDDELLSDVKHWEHYYSNEIEGSCIKSIRNIIARVTLSDFGQLSINEKERNDLSKYIVTQFTRVPQFIDHQIENARETFIPSYKRGLLAKYGVYLPKEKREVIEKIDFREAELKNIIMNNITDENKMSKYCEILASKIWIVYINKIYKSFPFVTSDNPVVMYNIVQNSFSRSDNGIGNQDTIIYFPLNPYVAIGIFPNRFRDALGDRDSRELLFDIHDVEFIGTMSRREIDQCYNQAFIPIHFYREIYKGE